MSWVKASRPVNSRESGGPSNVVLYTGSGVEKQPLTRSMSLTRPMQRTHPRSSCRKDVLLLRLCKKMSSICEHRALHTREPHGGWGRSEVRGVRRRGDAVGGRPKANTRN